MKSKHKSFFEVVDDYITEFLPKNLDARGLHEKMVEQLERSLISRTLKETNYNKSQSALILGLHRATLRKKIKDLNLKQNAKD